MARKRQEKNPWEPLWGGALEKASHEFKIKL